MAAPKGNKYGKGGPRPGSGRPKGVPNKSTRTMREAYTHFVESNIPQFQKLLNRVAKQNPAEALNIIARFSEFCLPKLMRAEVTGEDGAALQPPVLAISFASGGPGRGGPAISLLDDDSVIAVVQQQAPQIVATNAVR